MDESNEEDERDGEDAGESPKEGDAGGGEDKEEEALSGDVGVVPIGRGGRLIRGAVHVCATSNTIHI